jgi:D-alanine--poly(phosphoribitol) ligase subunit 2
MDRQTEILELVKKVSNKDVTPAPDESLFESGLLDSFALPDLVSALEEKFSVSIPDADLNPRKFDSVQLIESYLDQKK